MARPSLADSLKASLSKGVHVETAERIQRGLQPVLDDPLLTPAIDVIAPTHIVEYPLNQPDVNTTKKPLNQAINQANKQTINQASNQTDKQAEQQSNNQSNQQYSQLLDKQSDNQTVEQSVKQSPEQSIGQAINQTIRSIPQPSSRQIWLPLNENQGRLLLFLYENGGGLTNMDIIVEETGIAYGTARAGINVLLREGYVTYKARHNGHSFRGFEYAMNNHLCSLYAGRVRGEQNEQSNRQSLQQSGNQTNNQAIKQTIGQSGNQTNAVVSSYLTELKPTTTSDNTIIEDTLKDPELGYWRDKGVNSRQINNWSDEFQMPIEQVIQSLKYCRYEMIILNLEEEKQISNPTNWFYKVMQRSGLYPKPNGYKSLTEIRAEQMEQAAKEAAEARERQVAAQQELAFQRIMTEPDSNEYQALLDQVNEFAKEVGGKALEAALREAFNNNRKEIHHD